MPLETSVKNLLAEFVTTDTEAAKRLQDTSNGVLLTLRYMQELEERILENFEEFPQWHEPTKQYIKSLRGFVDVNGQRRHMYCLPLKEKQKKVLKYRKDTAQFFPLTDNVDYSGPIRDEPWVVQPIKNQEKVTAHITVLGSPLIVRKHALDQYHHRFADNLLWKEEQLHEVHKELIGSTSITPKGGKKKYCKKHYLEDIDFRLSKNGHVYPIGVIPGRDVPHLMTTYTLTPRFSLNDGQKKRYAPYIKPNSFFYPRRQD